jgi:hypothetical protein
LLLQLVLTTNAITKDANPTVARIAMIRSSSPATVSRSTR